MAIDKPRLGAWHSTATSDPIDNFHPSVEAIPHSSDWDHFWSETDRCRPTQIEGT
jgi:hypothetical protein